MEKGKHAVGKREKGKSRTSKFDHDTKRSPRAGGIHRSWYLLKLATRAPRRDHRAPLAARPLAWPGPQDGLGLGQGGPRLKWAKGQFWSKIDEKIQVLRMSLPIVENLSGLQESIFSLFRSCLLYTSPSPRDAHESRMPSSA